MANITQSMKDHLTIVKPSLKVLIILTALATIFAGISVRPYEQISWWSILFEICLIISLFGSDEKASSNTPKTAENIKGRYIFVILSYLAWFATMFILANTLAKILDDQTHLGGSLALYFASSFLSFSVIIAFQLAISYKKGSRSIMWIIFPIFLLGLLNLLLMQQTSTTQTILIWILANPHQAAALLFAISLLIWWTSYRITIKTCHHADKL